MTPTDADLAPHGWASGACVFEKCPNCGGPFEDVDRRAIRCRPCAVKSWQHASRDYGTALGDKLKALGFGQ